MNVPDLPSEIESPDTVRPQFRVLAKLKNNRMIRAREARGWTQVDLARTARVHQQEVCAYENLRKRPWTRRGEVRPAALQIAAALGLGLADLWSDDVGDVDPSVRTMEFDRAEVVPWIESPATPLEALEDAEEREIHEALFAELSSWHQQILAGRLEGQTATEVGVVCGLSRTRIDQLTQQALRTLHDLREGLEARAERDRLAQIEAGRDASHVCSSRHPVRGWSCTKPQGHANLHVPWCLDRSQRCRRPSGSDSYGHALTRCRLPHDHVGTCAYDEGAWIAPVPIAPTETLVSPQERWRAQTATLAAAQEHWRTRAARQAAAQVEAQRAWAEADRAWAEAERVRAEARQPCPACHPVHGWCCTRPRGHTDPHIPWGQGARCPRLGSPSDPSVGLNACRLPPEHPGPCAYDRGQWDLSEPSCPSRESTPRP